MKKTKAHQKAINRALAELRLDPVRRMEWIQKIKDCSHQFDFLILPLKIAIEVDGCWWHGCRKCNKEISHAAKEQRARDRWWEKKAKKVGWKVVRIWEHDTRVGQFARLCEALGLVKPLKEVPRGKGASIG
jgi:G:T-mismatch repair DNA endonuclease (very short patch repair protein)